MKRQLILLLLFVVGTGFYAQAQKPNRIAYIDMEYILANVPEYQQASQQLDQKIQQWRTELEQSQKKIEALKFSLEQERALLTKELIEEREANIAYEEGKLSEFQQKRFGPNGDFILQKKQLVKPIQDQVFNAIQELGIQRKYDFIFDRTSNVGMVFSSEEHNVSEQVLRMITRAGKREQLDSRKDLQQFEVEENRTVAEDKVLDDRQVKLDSVKNDREALIQERTRQRDSIKEAKQKAFDERRAKILAERQHKKDSLDALRKQKQENPQSGKDNN